MNKKELLDKIKNATIKKIAVVYVKDNSWKINLESENMSKEKSDVSLKSINDLLQIIVTKVDNLETKVDKIENRLNSHIQDFENFKNKIESLPTIQKELSNLNNN